VDFKNLKKKIFISIIVGIIIFAGLSIYSDFTKITKIFLTFNYKYIPLILILAPLNYCFRYIKWNYYLKKINICINSKDNMLIFASALAMTVTPGKIGELLKSYLLKERNNIPISHTAPLIMTERLTDGISMIILASFGVLIYDYGKGILFFVILFMVMFIFLVQSPKIINKLISLLGKIKILKKHSESFKIFYQNTYMLFKIKPLLFAIMIGVISWSFEGLIIFLTLKAMGIKISLLASIFIVSFSSIVGAISMLPGGLLAAEGSIFGLLLLMKIPKDIATITTIITRFSTLWLGVLIGIIALFLVQKKMFIERKMD